MFDFLKRKKKAAAAGAQKPLPSSSLKQSLLSLEQRLMFDAAAAATAAEVKSEQVAQEQAEAAVSTEASHETTGAENVESQDVLNALASYMPTESRTEVAFVDPTVPNYQELLAGMDPNTEVIMLDAGKDGVQQIADSLAGRTGVDAVHLISHGSSAELHLGTGTLTTESMSGEYAGELATIRAALSEHADLLVYGCDFAEGQTGLDAVQRLADLTGADVQASTDVTGHISLGGDWEFEVQTGAIETNLVVTDSVQMNWVGLLGTETVRDNFSTESYSNNDGTQSWASSWSETDASGGGASGGDVRVNSSQLRIDTDRVGNQASRQVNLSGTTGARLTFDYSSTLTGADRIEARISNDGGATYATLAGGVFSTAANTGSGTATFDISAYASANTRIQFIVTGTGGSDRLYVDNVQVSYTVPNSAPTISSNGGGTTASVSVAENNTAVTTVTATDADAGHALGYSIVGGADAAKFTINSSTGQLSFASAPNYEAPTDSGGNNVYDVTVQVSDGQGGTDTQAIAVTVANVNEAPTDLSLSANSVAENAANGTVIGTVSEAEPDSGDTKIYSLTDSAGGRFAINSATGQITVADGSLLNYESAASHNVTVRVTDSGGLTYDETFTINLTNVNETPTDLALSANSVAENTATGTVVGTVSGTEPDSGDTKTYSLTDTAGGRFAINASTGVLTVADGSLLDYESAASHSVTVRVTDNGGLTYDETFTINLTNVNEAPTGTDAIIIINEDTAHTLTTANFGFSDVDAGDSLSAVRIDTIPSAGSLTLSGGAVTAGQVVSVADITAGNLVFTPAADATGIGYASLTFSVRDSNNAYDAVPNTLTVNVTAVNDVPTDLSLSANTVVENAANGTVVGTMTGTDVDTGDTKSYSLTDTAGGRFAIDNSTGQITVADGRLLNYESATSHSVTVRVTDSGGLTYDETFTINLTNVNEVPTALALSANTVAENAANGTVVGTASTTDPDAGGIHIYQLTDTAGGRFAINASTGVITVADGSLLDYESATSHSVTVRVTDSGGLTHDQTFTIALTDVAEAPTRQSLPGSLVPIAPTSGPGNNGPLSSSTGVPNEITGDGTRPPDDLRRSIEIRTEASPAVKALSPERAPTRSVPVESLGGSLENAGAEEFLERSSSWSGEPGKAQGQMGPASMRSSDGRQADAKESEQKSGQVDAEEATDVALAVGMAGVVFQGGLSPKEKVTALSSRLRSNAPLSPASQGNEPASTKSDGKESQSRDGSESGESRLF